MSGKNTAIFAVYPTHAKAEAALHALKAKGFSTANFDMIRHYRPQMNVLDRPTQKSGRAYSFTGHHELMVPLLAAMIKLGRVHNE